MWLNDRSMIRLAAVAVLVVAAVALSGCGRKGALQAPTAAATGGETAAGTPADTAAKKSNRHFILDPLL